MVGPIARREAVGWLQTRGTSLRRACRVIGLSTATWRYQRRTNATNVAVLARLQAHAAVRARFGYRRLHILLEREGLVVNHKRVHRHLSRRRVTGASPPAQAAHARRNACRSAPAARALVDGLHGHAGRWRTSDANVVDDFTRECVAIEVDRSLPGLRVARGARSPAGDDRTAADDRRRQRAGVIAGRTLDAWAYAHGVDAALHSSPASQIENAYVESFNGKFRDECLNERSTRSQFGSILTRTCRSRLFRATRV